MRYDENILFEKYLDGKIKGATCKTAHNWLPSSGFDSARIWMVFPWR